MLGGTAFTVVFALPILFDDRLRHQGDHLAALRMYNRCPQHLVMVERLSIAQMFLQAILTVNRMRGKIARTVQREQVVALQKLEDFQLFAPLQRPKYLLEGWPQALRLHIIQNRAQLGVARNLFDLIDAVQILRIVSPPVVKGQQRGFFEQKQGKSAHQGVGQRYLCLLCAMILDLLETRPHQFE